MEVNNKLARQIDAKKELEEEYNRKHNKYVREKPMKEEETGKDR